jgi:hypothetical protein
VLARLQAQLVAFLILLEHQLSKGLDAGVVRVERFEERQAGCVPILQREGFEGSARLKHLEDGQAQRLVAVEYLSPRQSLGHRANSSHFQ